MGTVLLGWELGGGLSHVDILLELARELSRVGHTPILVLKDLVGPRTRLRGVPYRVFQAPIWSRPAPAGFAASSYSDILAAKGYADAEGLMLLVGAWQSLIDLTGTNLVICDYAPTLCLAAYGRTPSLVIGNGFMVPPVGGDEFPRLANGFGPPSRAADLLDVVREIQRRRGQPSPPSLPALLAPSSRFVLTLDELDPYRSARLGETVEPFRPLDPPLPAAGGNTFFAYLGEDYPGVDQILPHLASVGLEGSAYILGRPAGLMDTARHLGVKVYHDPLPLRRMLAEAALVLHHGGSNTAEAALAAGRPQVVLPAHLEHELNGNALEALGVGRSLTGQLTVEAVSSAVRDVLGSGVEVEQARVISKELQFRQYRGGLARIIERCDQLLSS